MIDRAGPRRAASPAAVALAVVAAAAGCGDRRGAAGDEVRLHLEAEPAHLNPLLAGDLLALRVALGDVYEPLWEEGEDGELEPVLAESWRRSADDRAWTLTIRSGVRWHDGRALTVGDVVFTLRLLAPGGAATPLAADLDDLQAVEVADERDVRLRFGGFRVGRDRSLARVPILPAHVFGDRPVAELATHPANRRPIGTGPYRFAAWEPGRELRLERWDAYWGRRPALARAAYRIVPDPTQAALQLGAGGLDLLARVPADQLGGLAADRQVTLVAYDVPTFTAVTWSCRRGALADERVRRALGLLLDRDTMVREVFAGRARPQAGPWAPGDPAADPAIAPPPFDPAGARRLLAEAGVTSGLEVAILFPQTSRAVERVLAIWREDARAAGVALVPVPAPYERVLERAYAGDFDAVALGWTSEREQDFYHAFHSSQIGAGNLGALRDGAVDRLLDAIRTTADPAARRALEHALHRRLQELEPITVIAGDVRTAAVRRPLRGVRLTLTGAPVRFLER